MPNDSSAIVQKLWNYCNVLRDDGISYGDYVEQLTYLLFLKMADEQTKPPFGKESVVPAGLDWESLVEKDGDALETHYRHILDELGRRERHTGCNLQEIPEQDSRPRQTQANHSTHQR